MTSEGSELMIAFLYMLAPKKRNGKARYMLEQGI